MQVRSFVGKDKRAADAKKKRVVRVYGPQVCRNCGDEYNQEGACVKCRAALEVYREVDDRNFRRFQGSRGGRVGA